MSPSEFLRYYRAASAGSAREHGRKGAYVRSLAAIGGVFGWHECCFGSMVYHTALHLARTGMVIA
jgi:hypothetical protein